MPTYVPVISHSTGDVLPASDWNNYLKANLDKLLDRGHRVLTVAQFSALTSPEGTKGTIAPDEVYLEVDATNGIQWHLAYESGEATYRWRFIGGPPLYSRIETAQGTASGSLVDLATVGPAITLPRAGDYDVRYGAGVNTTSGGGIVAFVAGGTEYSFSRLEGAGGGGTYNAQSSEGQITGRAASEVEKLQYAGTGGTLTYRGRYLKLTPVRVS